ncbi:acyl-CoA dehydratase activase [Candidatus Cloacimonadota bacterium]
MNKQYTCGIDIGSRTAKLVVLEDNKILYSASELTGINPGTTANQLLADALSATNLKKDNFKSICATGYGRKVVKFADRTISEISCHAAGVKYFYPEVRTVIDIGGQDSKIIFLNPDGRVTQFVMNDKCAAGTGRFLEVAANILELTVDDLGEVSAASEKDIQINSTCVVFAESEIIGLIAQHEEVSNIINAIHLSIAKRTRNLISQIHWEPPVVFTGGVAMNSGLKKSLSKILTTNLIVPDNSIITGALGAALLVRS